MPTKPLIETRALVKAYGLRPVLRGVEVQIARGEFVALLGANGSGKSTFLRLLCGLAKPTSGAITVGGWTLPKEAAAIRAQVGYVGHRPLLYETLTAWENLRFFGALYGLTEHERDARIATLLKRVGLAKRGHDLVRTYSRGMQQRLSIARALLHQPDVLLLDEPHTGLDQEAAQMLDTVVREAQNEGRTLLMTTHDLERAAALATRVIILARGNVAYDAPMAGLRGESLAVVYRDVTGTAAGAEGASV